MESIEETRLKRLDFWIERYKKSIDEYGSSSDAPKSLLQAFGELFVPPCTSLEDGLASLEQEKMQLLEIMAEQNRPYTEKTAAKIRESLNDYEF